MNYQLKLEPGMRMYTHIKTFKDRMGFEPLHPDLMVKRVEAPVQNISHSKCKDSNPKSLYRILFCLQQFLPCLYIYFTDIRIPVSVRVNSQTVSWPHRSQGTKTWPAESYSCRHDHSRKTWIRDRTPSPPGSNTKNKHATITYYTVLQPSFFNNSSYVLYNNYR